MGLYVRFKYYNCPNCGHCRQWPWSSDPEKELGDKCEKCGCKIIWIESWIPA